MIPSASVRAVRDYRSWAEQEGRPLACPDCLEALLDGRAAYLNRRDPTRWRRGDARALLYDLAVPRLTEYCDLIAHTVPAIDAYLSFLDQTGRLHPGSAAVRYLRQELAEQAGGFPAAMADRSRFRMAKTLYQTMLADGVPLDDDEAVDAWMARFNQAPRADRVAVLEHLLIANPDYLTADFAARQGKVAAIPPGRGPFDSRRLLPAIERLPEVMPVFAPVSVPSRGEAAEAARRSGLLRDLLALARWIGQGRKATHEGEPVPADVRRLAAVLGLEPRPVGKVSQPHHVFGLWELFWLARQLDLVGLRHTGLVAGPALAIWGNVDALTTRDDAEVLELWGQVFELVEVGREVPEEAYASKRASLDGIGALTKQFVPTSMVALYRAAALGADRPLEDLLAPAVEKGLGRPGAPQHEDAELAAAVLRIALCASLDRLVEHGALEVSGLGLWERAFALADIPGVWVRLTPLGRWAMREVLLATGAEAPADASLPRARRS